MAVGRRRPGPSICTLTVTRTRAARGVWSGKRDSNPRLRPWQGRTLPLSYSRPQPGRRYATRPRIVKPRRAARRLDLARAKSPIVRLVKRGGVAKWLRRRSAKPLFAGSTPAAASSSPSRSSRSIHASMYSLEDSRRIGCAARAPHSGRFAAPAAWHPSCFGGWPGGPRHLGPERRQTVRRARLILTVATLLVAGAGSALAQGLDLRIGGVLPPRLGDALPGRLFAALRRSRRATSTASTAGSSTTTSSRRTSRWACRVDGYKQTVDSFYRDYTRPDGSEIRQQLKLWTHPGGRDGAHPADEQARDASCPTSAAASTRSSTSTRSTATSSTSTTPTYPIHARLCSTTRAPRSGVHAVAGLRVYLNRDFAIVGEGRYQWAKKDMGEDFAPNAVRAGQHDRPERPELHGRPARPLLARDSPRGRPAPVAAPSRRVTGGCRILRSVGLAMMACMKLSRIGAVSLGLLVGSTLAGGVLGGRALAGGGRLSDQLRLYTAMMSAVERRVRGRGAVRPARLLVDPRDAPHAGPSLELLRAEGLPDDAGAPEGAVLRPRHHGAVGRRQHHRRRAVRGHAGAPPRHPRRRRHQPHRGRGRPRDEHRRRGQAPARAEGHAGARSRSSARATRSRSSSR